MDSPCQFSQSSRLDRIFSILKISYCALGNFGLPREKLCRKLFCFGPDLIQIFRVDYSFVVPRHNPSGAGEGQVRKSVLAE
jgi:hypothetical protein